MRFSKWCWWVPALLLVVHLAVVPAPARATELDTGATPSTVEGSDPDSAIGVVGTILCGGGGYLIRTNPTVGLNPWVLSATIGGCILLAIDCF